ncbi:flagellar biosynthesis protein FlhB [Oryzomonas japonica]|uniref:Flagellar biosynthetic protein FlhB n=1 Tax=Oryzomonas japonica TaxID=2603858 RepID=A0A7J4ZUF0_9BACT|nr:flagellar biosynthesis protein FlhB [Oryzomonas japonica]KAB0667197.1 flagellar biosynthesis protein FlhB [Oryzomonas japonica]
MGEDSDKHSKTEQPTAKKLSEARKKGAPPKSQVLTSSLTLLSGIITLYIFGSYMMDGLKKHMVSILSTMGTFDLTESNMYTLSLKLFALVLMLLAPLVVTIIVTAILANIIQDNGQFEFQTERLAFDITRLNPMNGFGRLFNKDALMEMVKSLLKLLVVGYVTYRVMKDESQNIAFLAEADIETIITYVGHIAFQIITHACGVLIVLGVLDLMYVKWRYIDKLKMTKQEVKEETKEQDISPEIKGQIKKMQYQMARRRMIKIVPTADVVITNPTHYAVALKYDRERMLAPVVIAKGADVMAQAIKKIAREHKVTLVENRFLARELYDQVDENAPIPESLYAAVAEVLAYVYRLKGKM